jgi:hypothetical protein
MNGVAVAVPSPTDGDDIAAAVRARLSAAGIPSDDPIVPIIAGLAEMVETTGRHASVFSGALSRLDAAIKAERTAMKAATEHCVATTQKLEATYGTMEIRSHNLMTQTIHTMAGQVADRMREQMVIVERRHNRVALWRRAGLLTAVVILIFGLGFGAARYADQEGVALLDRCLAHPLMDSQTGGLLCALEAAQSGG